jgi:hypothetical protein
MRRLIRVVAEIQPEVVEGALGARRASQYEELPDVSGLAEGLGLR